MLHSELEDVARRMDLLVARSREAPIQGPLTDLQAACEHIGKAWSRSWLGYHANVYYATLEPPPPGAHFSQEWGLKDTFSGGTVGDWVEFDPKDVEAAIRARAGNPDLKLLNTFRDEVAEEFDLARMDVLSILDARKTEPFIKGVLDQLEEIAIGDVPTILDTLKPKGEFMSRDTLAIGQGFWTPPHLSNLSRVLAVRIALDGSIKLGTLARQAAKHIQRHGPQRAIGENVFIGHGQSPLWRELKDFLQDRLGLRVDEFDRVPVAGVTHIDRLMAMMESARMALILMTADDEQSDGTYHPRMNVVHEAGLFQGRLGFSRAIVILEDGCEEFSNIQGLGQIRFPSENIKAVFEDVRSVLEREGIVNTD